MLYDGACGLCHRAVRLALAEDRDGRFRFATLQDAPDLGAILPVDPSTLPTDVDSSLVLTEDGRILARSAAVLEALHRFGGLWRLIAYALAVLPRVVLDAGYDLVAGLRHRLFPNPKEACPMIPPELRGRFAVPPPP